MSFPYKHIIIFGATSGIGAALAEQFFSICETVILTGRREDNLRSLCSGHANAYYRVHDIADHASIAPFAASVLADFPQLDCVLLNSGIQRGFDFSHPETVDLSVLELELDTNYVSYLHVLKYFLPHLLKQEKAAVIATSSGLAMVPMARCPNYCATKAALHHFWLALRMQMVGRSVKVIEIFPPLVQTEIHDTKHQPDYKGGNAHGMTLEDFTTEAWEGLMSGEEEIPVGTSKMSYEKIERARQDVMRKRAEALKK